MTLHVLKSLLSLNQREAIIKSMIKVARLVKLSYLILRFLTKIKYIRLLLLKLKQKREITY